jgi:hypothetical protein
MIGKESEREILSIGGICTAAAMHNFFVHQQNRAQDITSR